MNVQLIMAATIQKVYFFLLRKNLPTKIIHTAIDQPIKITKLPVKINIQPKKGGSA